MKRIRGAVTILGYILAVQLLLAIPAAALPSDVQDHWSAEQVGRWIDRGLVHGYEDGTFRPDQDITRAEFTAVVNRAFGFSEKGAVGFSDVPSEAWFAEDIAKAKAAGYISGYEDGSVKPYNYINRTEAAAILAVLLELNGSHPDSLTQYKDASDIPPWGRGYFEALVAGKYLQGYPDNTLRPLQNISRAEAVSLLAGALDEGSQAVINGPEVTEPSGAFSGVTKTITIGGMSCQMCVEKVTNALAALDGVQVVSVEVGAAVVSLSEDVNEEELTATIEDLGYTVTSIEVGEDGEPVSTVGGDGGHDQAISGVTKNITIGGMSCQMCVEKVTKALAALDGVQVVSVEVGAAVVSLSKDVSDEKLTATIEDLGYTVISIQGS